METAHIVEILREAGSHGLRVTDIFKAVVELRPKVHASQGEKHGERQKGGSPRLAARTVDGPSAGGDVMGRWLCFVIVSSRIDQYD